MMFVMLRESCSGVVIMPATCSAAVELHTLTLAIAPLAVLLLLLSMLLLSTYNYKVLEALQVDVKLNGAGVKLFLRSTDHRELKLTTPVNTAFMSNIVTANHPERQD